MKTHHANLYLSTVLALSSMLSASAFAQAPDCNAPVAFDNAVVNQNPPAYPKELRKNRVQGRGIWQVKVLPDGTPGEVHLEQTSGNAALDREGDKAIRNWRFSATQAQGCTNERWLTIPLVWSLAS